jgi:hypothetical protein
MRRFLLVFAMAALLMAGTAPAFAGVGFDDFEAEARDGRVLLTWSTSHESGCAAFVIEKSSGDNPGTWTTLPNEFAPQGIGGGGAEYQYTDRDLFKQSVRTLHYRIRAKMADGSSVTTETLSVTVIPTGIQQTWGGLKAMFR